MANSDVRLKHKVQLRKKVEEPVVPVEAVTVETGNTPTPGKSSSKTWIWVLLGVTVCIICYFLLSKSRDKTVQTPEQDIEIAQEPSVATDILTNTEETKAAISLEKENTNDANNQEEKEDELPVTRVEVSKNSSMSTSSTANIASISNDVEAEAMKVIRGDYGVGQERKDKLGTQYRPIQNRVNQLKREGAF